MKKITKTLAKKLLPKRPDDSNKGTFGKVLNIAGSIYYQGAAYLASLTPLKIGAGLSTLASIEPVINNLASSSPCVTFLPLKDYQKKCISSEAFDDGLKTYIKNYNVISTGPGLSDHEQVKIFISKLIEFLSEENKPAIFDADALNCLSKIKPSKLPPNFLITPHPMELSRLIEIPLEEIQANREKYAKYTAEKLNCNVILKGHKTIICTKSLELYENTTGNSALAKAGSGDVLTGIISGLCSQKLPLEQAAILGVFIHGLCGDIASKDLTNYSVLSSDQIKYIPKALKYILT